MLPEVDERFGRPRVQLPGKTIFGLRLTKTLCLLMQTAERIVCGVEIRRQFHDGRK
jgi:hypothetical protein